MKIVAWMKIFISLQCNILISQEYGFN